MFYWIKKIWAVLTGNTAKLIHEETFGVINKFDSLLKESQAEQTRIQGKITSYNAKLELLAQGDALCSKFIEFAKTD